jgi:hypothetical protein
MASVLATVRNQIVRATLALVEGGVVADQNMPSSTKSGRTTSLTIASDTSFSELHADITYREMYELVVGYRMFNMRLRDGGVVQMHYEFMRGTVTGHRLAFFPSPDLESMQAEPELYLNDYHELFADWLEQRSMPVPVRFDHDARAARGLDHPSSHLTLGQFTHCRIPATGPLYPVQFIDFVLRSFYNSSYSSLSSLLPRVSATFAPCASKAEYTVVHIGVPGSSRYPG